MVLHASFATPLSTRIFGRAIAKRFDAIVLYYRDGRSFIPVWRTVVLSRVASLTAAGASDWEFGLNTQRQLAAKLKETPAMIPIAAPIAG